MHVNKPTIPTYQYRETNKMYKILIADDEADIVEMLSCFFTGKGFLVLTARNGAETVRFARTLVTLSFRKTENGLLLTVTDDGDGFDENTIRQTVKPFFTQSAASTPAPDHAQNMTSGHSQHFGLGLYICKLLREHHGGCLQLENGATGAKVTAYFQFGKRP